MRPLSADGALWAEMDAGSARGYASLNKATEAANRSIGEPRQAGTVPGRCSFAWRTSVKDPSFEHHPLRAGASLAAWGLEYPISSVVVPVVSPDFSSSTFS